jgi:hypothetical protein
LVECGTDRRSICLGDYEHCQSMGRSVRIGKLFLTRRTTYNEMVSCRPSWRHGRRSRNRIVAKCATRRAASRRPSAAQLIAKNRSSTMGATVTVRA